MAHLPVNVAELDHSSYERDKAQLNRLCSQNECLQNGTLLKELLAEIHKVTTFGKIFQKSYQ
jgi:GH35 family endo-1,4-beta-xylanase